jgi:DUF4097 and DUF4098 domain-containing protein YvlB
MKKNIVVTLCVAVGLVAAGVYGLIIGMNMDKQNQSKRMEQVPMNVSQSEEANEESDTAEGTGSKNTNDSGEKTLTMTFNGITFAVDYAKKLEDEKFEISLEAAVNKGLDYIKDTYGSVFNSVAVHMDTTSTSGIRNGSVAWYAVVEVDNEKRYELTINTQTGEVIDSQAYYIEGEETDKWVKADTSSKQIEYKTEKLDLEAFSDIEVNINHNADVEIVTGDSYGVIIHYYGPNYSIDYRNTDGKLKIEDDVKMTTDWRNYLKEDNYVTIIVPKKSKISNIDIVAASGDISLKDIKAEQLKTLTYSGDSSFVGLSINEGDMQTYSGDIDVKDLQSKAVKLTSISGDITVKGNVYGDNKFEATSGDVEIECSGRESDYSYNLNTTSGSIDVNGETVEEDFGASKSVHNSKDNMIKVTSISGDITIDFDK